MAHYLGAVQGSHGDGATRLGTKSSGIRATVCSWDGSVMMQLVNIDGAEYVDIAAEEDSTTQPRALVARIPLSAFLNGEVRKAINAAGLNYI